VKEITNNFLISFTSAVMVLVNKQVCPIVIGTVFLVPLPCQTILKLVKPFRNWSANRTNFSNERFLCQTSLSI